MGERWTGSRGLVDDLITLIMKLSYAEWVSTKAPLQSTENYSQQPVINCNRKAYEKEHICICVYTYICINWVTLLHNRNEHNIVHQLSANKIKLFKCYLPVSVSYTPTLF